MPNSNDIRILLIADTHLGFDYPVRPRIERRRRGDDFFANFDRILRYATETKPDMVVHGGDLFFRAKVPEPVVDEVYNRLIKFSQTGIPFYVVPGNHERSRLPSIERLNHPHIHLFDKPKTYRCFIRNTAITLSGFPCVRKGIKTTFKQVLDQTEWKEHIADIHLLVMHQSVQGAKVGPGDYTFEHGPDVIPMQDIPPDFDAVLCGHIHRRQLLKGYGREINPQGFVVYPGAIERTSFAERFEDKGFFELTFSKEFDGSGYKTQKRFIRLPARPMVDIELESTLSPDRVSRYLRTKSRTLPSDSIVRLKFVASPDGSHANHVTSELIRQALPSSMNFQYSAEVLRSYRFRKNETNAPSA